jgi:thiol:disulfide interchange protein DsbC
LKFPLTIKKTGAIEMTANFRTTIVIAACLHLAAAGAGLAYQKEAGPVKECSACHSLDREKAAKLLQKLGSKVVDVGPGPFPGTWEVDVEKDGKRYPLYLDYSGKYLFNGQVIRLRDMENLSSLRYIDLNRVDVSAIPLDDAIVLGNPGAKRRVIVFDDPDCAWCRKLHGEIKQIVASDPEVAFFVRVYSRNNNPASVRKALSIVCGKKEAANRLDDAFAGKKLPDPDCRSDSVEVTAKLARELGIQGTPALVFPDGKLVSGYMPADALRKLIRGEK